MLAARAGLQSPGPPASRAWFPGLLVNGPPAKSRRRLLVPVPPVPVPPVARCRRARDARWFQDARWFRDAR